jgi:hypothetical protein
MSYNKIIFSCSIKEATKLFNDKKREIEKNNIEFEQKLDGYIDEKGNSFESYELYIENLFNKNKKNKDTIENNDKSMEIKFENDINFPVVKHINVSPIDDMNEQISKNTNVGLPCRLSSKEDHRSMPRLVNNIINDCQDEFIEQSILKYVDEF